MSEAAKPAPAPAGRAGSKKELPEHFKAYKHVWVVVESEHGEVHPVSFELLGEGRLLANKRGVELAAVVLGANAEAIARAARECFEYGADLVYTVNDPVLTHYRNESYTKAMTDLVNTYQPEILLLGATTLGRDLAG
jgi:electron transfer flavoprotein alpha subunit